MEEDRRIRFSPKTTQKEPLPTQNSVDQTNICFKPLCRIQNIWILLQKYKLPGAFCLFVYITICLLGNIVTGVIYINQQKEAKRKLLTEDDKVDNNGISDDSDGDEQQPILNYDYTDEYSGDENFDLSTLLFLNDSQPEVSVNPRVNHKLLHDIKNKEKNNVFEENAFLSQVATIFVLSVIPTKILFQLSFRASLNIILCIEGKA